MVAHNDIRSPELAALGLSGEKAPMTLLERKILIICRLITGRLFSNIGNSPAYYTSQCITNSARVQNPDILFSHSLCSDICRNLQAQASDIIDFAEVSTGFDTYYSYVMNENYRGTAQSTLGDSLNTLEGFVVFLNKKFNLNIDPEGKV